MISYIQLIFNVVLHLRCISFISFSFYNVMSKLNSFKHPTFGSLITKQNQFYLSLFVKIVVVAVLILWSACYGSQIIPFFIYYFDRFITDFYILITNSDGSIIRPLSTFYGWSFWLFLGTSKCS